MNMHQKSDFFVERKMINYIYNYYPRVHLHQNTGFSALIFANFPWLYRPFTLPEPDVAVAQALRFRSPSFL